VSSIQHKDNKSGDPFEYMVMNDRIVRFRSDVGPQEKMLTGDWIDIDPMKLVRRPDDDDKV